MTGEQIVQKRTIVGIMGSHRDDDSSIDDARLLGEALAQRGHILLTGGGTGIMRAASEGAYSAGGLVVGILPGDRKTSRPGYPNEFVHIPIYTGMGDARNVINAITPDVIIALSGSYGTLSEIVLALNAATPVISLEAPSFECPSGAPLYPVSSVQESLDLLDHLLTTIRD